MKEYFKRKIDIYRDFWVKYERHISSGALLLGFIIDSLTLRRVDMFLENLVFFAYLTIAGTGILLLNLCEAGRLRGYLFERLPPFLLIAIQFAFGGLFSGFVVFYYRSASLSVSWPFILILAIMLVGNELFKKYYLRLSFQMGIFFLALLGVMIYFVPLMVGQIGASVFLMSGVTALLLVTLFSQLIKKLIPIRYAASRKSLVISVGVVYAVITVFYFANIIPPIPLAAKEVRAYHSVTRTAEGYVIRKEPARRFDFLRLSETVHLAPGEPVYVYTSIFAPSAFESMDVVHKWEYYNSKTNRWVESSRITFTITGGRDEGYRGYSMKSAVFPGLWRVDVETLGGQRIGRAKFKVKAVDTEVQLEREVR
ncbi:MAG TPA: DUF2914 domain-containing protein [Candidatus Paceibacterota bacterium]|nr:DUF2914 domain-containing protein [Candidatus Paceibacterota bacterium]